MTWRWGRGLAMVPAALAVLGMPGCSSNDPIQPNNGNVTVTVRAVPAYAGSFLWARLQVDQITLRPFDPLTNSYLSIPLGLLQTTSEVDVRSTETKTIVTVPLKAGTYRVEEIRISSLNLNVVNEKPIPAVACSGGELIAARADGITILQLDPPQQLQVPVGGSAAMSLAIDGPGVVSMLTSLPYNCSSTAFPTPTEAQLSPFISLN